MVDQIENSEQGLSVRTKLNTLIDRHNEETDIESAARTIYVETTGDDVTGDGSVGSPFATILRALQDIGTYVNASMTIEIGAGTFDWDVDCVNEFSRFRLTGNPNFRFNGDTPTAVETGLTLTPQVGKEWTYDVSGGTFTPDEHNERWLYDGSRYAPIIENGTDTIGSFMGFSASTGVYELVTTVNFETETFTFPADILGGKVQLDNIILDFGTDTVKTKAESNYTILKDSMIKCLQMELGFDFKYPKFLFNHVYLLATGTSIACKSYFVEFSILGMAIRCVNGGLIGYDSTGDTSAAQFLVKNADYGIAIAEDTLFKGNPENSESHVTIIDCTNGFSITDLSHVHLSGSEYITFIDNVDYILEHRLYDPTHSFSVLILDLRGSPNIANLSAHLVSLSPPNYNANIVIT